MAEDGPTRRDLFDALSGQDPDLLHCVAREWNWVNGTWLLHWVAEQPTCTRSTAQRIFWDCEPETFLSDDARRRSPDRLEQLELAGTVLERWRAGAYPADRQSATDRLRLTLAGSRRFRADDGTWYRPGQVGWFDPANPIPLLEAYRAAEAWNPADRRPWTVPDDLGRVQRLRRPSHTAFELEDGVPEEFVGLLDDDLV